MHLITMIKTRVAGIWLLLIAFASLANAQQQEIDSIQTKLRRAKEDTFKVNMLLALSKAYIGSDPQTAILYAGQARDLSEKIQFQKGLAYALKNIGNANAMSGKFLEALDSWEKSLAVFSAIGDKKGVANILSNEGALYYNKSDDARALELYLKALDIAEQSGDTIRMATVLQNIGAVYSNKPSTQDKALEYYLKAYPFCLAAGDKEAIGNVEVNLGEIYLAEGKDSLGLYHFEKSLKALEGSNSTYIPYTLNDIGKVYRGRKDFATAINYHQKAYDKAKRLGSKLHMAQSLTGIADTYLQEGLAGKAIPYYREAVTISQSISGVNYELKNAYAGLALSYAEVSDYTNAYKYQSMLVTAKDSLYNIDTDKKLSGLQFNFDIQKKQSQINLLTKDKALQQLELVRQKFAKNALAIGVFMLMAIAVIIYRNYRLKVKTNRLLDSQKLEIENLLLNILPAEVAKELQTHGLSTPRYYESVSVLFTDFKGFTTIADSLSPQQLVANLSECFTAFDNIVEKHGIEKIKTIGDSYMCAGGIPTEDNVHPVNIIKAAFEIIAYIKEMNERIVAHGGTPWEARVGIHTGSVVAGVVGRKKYAYDIWGSTVNIASRMESNGMPGQVNISSALYELVKHEFECEYRGKIYAKNVGEIDMYFVKQPLSSLNMHTAIKELQQG